MTKSKVTITIEYSTKTNQKMLYIVLLSVFIIIDLVCIAALFISKEYTITRSIVINKPQQTIYNYVKHIKNQDYYNLWVMKDPNMQKVFTGTDGSIGFIYAWNGNKQAGEGEQEITKLIEDEHIGCEIRFVRPFKSVAATTMTIAAIGTEQAEIVWSMAGKSKYPMNFMNLFMDSLLGKDLTTSLTKLKAILEK